MGLAVRWRLGWKDEWMDGLRFTPESRLYNLFSLEWMHACIE